jgi:hypothetical protein
MFQSTGPWLVVVVVVVSLPEMFKLSKEAK